MPVFAFPLSAHGLDEIRTTLSGRVLVLAVLHSAIDSVEQRCGSRNAGGTLAEVDRSLFSGELRHNPEDRFGGLAVSVQQSGGPVDLFWQRAEL